MRPLGSGEDYLEFLTLLFFSTDYEQVDLIRSAQKRSILNMELLQFYSSDRASLRRSVTLEDGVDQVGKSETWIRHARRRLPQVPPAAVELEVQLEIETEHRTEQGIN
jgi:hypothetical protein